MTATRRLWRQGRNRERGASAVEFAIVLPVLLLILFGIIEFGIILFDKAVITNASREAARERIDFKAPDESVIKAKILENYGSLPITFGADSITTDDISFSSATDSTNNSTFVTATVQFHYDFLYLPIKSLNLTSATTMRQE
jgi:hypothetical protein